MELSLEQRVELPFKLAKATQEMSLEWSKNNGAFEASHEGASIVLTDKDNMWALGYPRLILKLDGSQGLDDVVIDNTPEVWALWKIVGKHTSISSSKQSQFSNFLNSLA